MSIKKVLIAGAGTMGQQIGFQCAMHGFEVVTYNHRQPTLDACRKAHQQFAVLFQAQRGKSAAEVEAALARMSYTTDLADACKDVDLISESVPEELALKRSLYPLLNEYCPPSTIFTTNTSTLLPSQIAESTGRPERFMCMHFVVGVWNANVVELMVHPGTSQETFDAVYQFAKAIGMVPVTIAKEQQGYIINSLLIPWAFAAQSLVTNGVSTPEDIDKTWMISTRSPAGPFGFMDMVGLGTAYTILKTLAETTGDQQLMRNAAYIKEHFIDSGKLGLKTGEGYYHYPNPAFQEPEFLT